MGGYAMKERMVKRILSVVLALGFVLPAYSQGVYWETVTSGGPAGEKGHLSTMYHMPKMFKAVVDESGQTMILRIDKQLIYMVDPKRKTYSEMTFDEMEGAMKKAGEAMDGQMAELQKQMEDMPEEQRKMMEQMMGGKMKGMMKRDAAAKVKVNKTGNKKKIGNYQCTKVEVTDDDKPFFTAWVTKDVGEFEAMRDDMEQFRKRIIALNPMSPKGLSEAMAKIEGLPIEMEMEGGMKQVVTKIEKRSIPASEFEIPAGYEKVESELMQGMKEK